MIYGIVDQPQFEDEKEETNLLFKIFTDLIIYFEFLFQLGEFVVFENTIFDNFF